ncbi:54s ribosomal protein l24 [Ophiostoma piceae UAMH 11346]|uniref:54s ribosomal protein l24 n=1 Tax=Ophiostoma piceae (strain UAMH 11346) TaxID=1262450 RepID=S3BUF9_OPHP1|nr:54s ribosomal protein l24 [Ophiostoma piceae UAMH 11346]
MAPAPLLAARAGRLSTSSLFTTSASTSTQSAVLAQVSQISQISQIRSYRQVAPPVGPAIPSPTANRPDIPPYPYGPRRVFKQSNKGLYGNSVIQFGNIVSRETEIINPQKNRRKWWPNIQLKRLWSESLGVHVRTRINTRVLRTIDKVGGLDEYLLGNKPARIHELGPWGWRLRWRIMQTDAVKERFRRERVALGLPAEGLYAQSLVAESADASETTEVSAEESAETQKMLDDEEVFDMSPPEGFMAESKKP